MVYEAASPNGVLLWVVTGSHNFDLSDFNTLFSLAVGDRLPSPFFAYGTAYCDEKWNSHNVYLSTPSVIFCIQKKLPVLMADDRENEDFVQLVKRERRKFDKDWPKISHFWNLVSDLFDEGRVPTGWKLCYVRSDADPKWNDEDVEKPLGICCPDGTISWFEEAEQLWAALGVPPL
jgi:hypothetical protein